MSAVNPSEIRRDLVDQLFCLPLEVRIVKARGKATTAGYFDNLEAAKAAVIRWNGKRNVYATLNPVNPDLLSRGYNKLIDYIENTTSDADIPRLKRVLIDIDPERPSGISSTDAEHDRALEIARYLRDYLVLEYNIDSYLCDSGNGAHVVLIIDYENTPENTRNLKNVLIYLGHLFDDIDGDIKIKVDKTTYNPARITKFYGTTAVKGDNTPTRPHRISAVLEVPQTAEPANMDKLFRDADEHVKTLEEANKAKREPSELSGRSIDAKEWLDKHGIPVAQIKPGIGCTHYILDGCPMNSSHEQDLAACVTQFDNGALAFKCHHDRCSGLGWRDLRRQFEVAKDYGSPLDWNDPIGKEPEQVVPNNNSDADIICFSNIQAKEVDWLGPFPRGMLGTVQGDPGGGKTFLMTKICADLSNGKLPPDDFGDCLRIDPQNVVIVNGEDDPSYTIKPRLIKAGADCSRVFTMDERKQPFSFDQLARLENMMEKIKPVLVVFDPLQQFLGQNVDMHRANEVRPVLAALGNLMAKYQAVCIMVMHMNKYGGGKAQYRGLGSIDFSAIARTQFLVGNDRNEKDQRLFIQIKNNLGRMQMPQGFTISDDGVSWTGIQINATEKDILQEAAAKEDTLLNDCIVFLRKIIIEEPVWSDDLEARAEEAGFSKRTLRRAREAMQDSWEAESVKDGKRWLFKKRGKDIDSVDKLRYASKVKK